MNEGDVVTIYDDMHPRGLWGLGKIEDLIHGSDGVVRCSCEGDVKKGTP